MDVLLLMSFICVLVQRELERMFVLYDIFNCYNV
jgi:hypothetical protein